MIMFLIGFVVVTLLLDRQERRPPDMAYYYGVPGSVAKPRRRGFLGFVWLIVKSIVVLFLLVVLLNGIALMVVSNSL